MIAPETIAYKCLKVLRAKEWAGLDKFKPIALDGLTADLNPQNALALRRNLYADALTVVSNKGVIPIRSLDSLRIASLVIGDALHNTFQKALGRYAPVGEFACDKILNAAQARKMLDTLKGFDLVITSVHGTSTNATKEFGVPQLTLDFLRRLNDQQTAINVLFANPYRLGGAIGAQRWKGIVVAYEENDDTEDLTAQMLFGAVQAIGKLPVTASGFFKQGQGQETASLRRLRYGLPEEEGIQRKDLARVDSIALDGVKAMAYPGCDVLVAYDGMVVMDRAYGSSTYTGGRPVQTDDIYDLASISKVMGTTLALMKLSDEGKVDVERTLGDYLPWIASSPYHASLTLSEILAHQSGLKPFVPFYLKLMDGGKMKPGVATLKADSVHTLRVAEGIYINSAYQDSITKWILATPLGKRGDYVYSDMGMYLLKKVIEKVSGMPMDVYLRHEFYAPLGLSTMGYQPLNRFPKDRIMPTENDTYFRMQQVHGDVHDPGAAMMGGVAGHAGLFSDANDIAIVMQMLLDGGAYGGRRYLKRGTVDKFTKCRFCTGQPGKENRRGLGWDRPADKRQPGPTSDNASSASFGHTGFTGTMVWADPRDRSTYVFLSNRVYPDAGNKKLSHMDISTKIQSVVHEAIAAAEKEGPIPTLIDEPMAQP